MLFAGREVRIGKITGVAREMSEVHIYAMYTGACQKPARELKLNRP